MSKIAKLETFSSEFVCFVRLTTDAGEVGWGVDIDPQWLVAANYQVPLRRITVGEFQAGSGGGWRRP